MWRGPWELRRTRTEERGWATTRRRMSSTNGVSPTRRRIWASSAVPSWEPAERAIPLKPSRLWPGGLPNTWSKTGRRSRRNHESDIDKPQASSDHSAVSVDHRVVVRSHVRARHSGGYHHSDV